MHQKWEKRFKTKEKLEHFKYSADEALVQMSLQKSAGKKAFPGCMRKST